MPRYNAVLHYIFDVIPDEDFRGNPIHVLDIKNICDGREIEEYFKDHHTIKLRELFNNLDGDDRAISNYLDNHLAGMLLKIASSNAIQTHEYEDGPDSTKYGDMDYDKLVDIIEEDFNQTFCNMIDNVCSYLFGRHVLTTEFKERHIELYETMLLVCEDIVWALCVRLTSLVTNIEDIAEILNGDESLIVVARWEVDCMLVSFLSKDELKPTIRQTILNRGMINDTRYDNSHRLGSRHQSLLSYRRSGRE